MGIKGLTDQIEAFLGARPGKYFTGTEVPGEGDVREPPLA